MGIAIFIDIENLTDGLGYRADECGIDFAATFARISRKKTATDSTISTKKSIAIAAAYSNISTDRPLGAIVRDLRQLNVSLRDLPGHRYRNTGGTGKDAADFQISVDAVELAVTRPDIDTFVIMSGDNGYYALANKLKELGKTVILVVKPSQKHEISEVYRRRVDRVILCALNQPAESLEGEPQISSPAFPSPSRITQTDLIPAEIRELPQVMTTFERANWCEYCSTINGFFSAGLGEIIKSGGNQGLLFDTTLSYLKYLVPNGTPQKVGFKSWIVMLRFALPESYYLLSDTSPNNPRIVHVDYLGGRDPVPPLTIIDLGDEPYLNTAIGITAPIDKISYIIEWCAYADGEFTAKQCLESFQDDYLKGGIDYSAVSRSLKTLALLGFLEQGPSPLHNTNALVTRGIDLVPGATQMDTLSQDLHYTKISGYSEASVLERVVDEVTKRAQEINWPLGTRIAEALADMKERVSDLTSFASTDIARGSGLEIPIVEHTWEALPPV